MCDFPYFSAFNSTRLIISTLYTHALANTNFFTRSGSGLQIGFYLERAGRDYVIFERDGLAGENF